MNRLESPEPMKHLIELYSSAAGAAFDISFDDTTITRWLDLINLTRLIDNELDEPGGWLTAAENAALHNRFTDRVFLENTHPSLTPGSDSSTYEQYCQISKQILSINSHAKRANTPHRHILLRQQEGHLFAKLLLAGCTDQVTQQSGYGQFAENFIRLGGIGNLTDTLIDAGKDYRRGEITAYLKAGDRLKLAGRIGYNALRLSPRALHPRSVSVLVATTALVAVQRFVPKLPEKLPLE